MDKQIYKFTFDEVKELTYNQLKIFSIIRQFSIDNVSKIYVDEIVRRTKLVKTNVYKDIRVLQSKHYITKEDKEYIILKPISKGEQFLYWIDNDLSLGLTYNQFVLYCLIRTNSNKFGYAMLKYSTITDLVGITKNNISRTVKELIEKGLIRAERQDTYAKYWTIEKSKYEECLDNSSENVEELPKEIQLIVAEDKKEETIYDKIAGIFGWDALPKIGVGLVDACYQTYNDAEVDIGTIIYGCLRQTRYRRRAFRPPQSGRGDPHRRVRRSPRRHYPQAPFGGPDGGGGQDLRRRREPYSGGPGAQPARPAQGAEG